MNKYWTAAIVAVVSAFLMLNFYLLYSQDSVIPKLVPIQEYERMTKKDYKKEQFKESLVAPIDAHTVYVGDEETVESWLVREGDEVFIGQELAVLNIDRIENERELWEREQAGLLDQQITLEDLRDELTTLRKDANTHSTSKTDRDQHVTEVPEKTRIELGLNIGFTVDITQEGSYAQAIASIDQQLSDVERQLTVIDAQLAQDVDHPALISPVSGVVSTMTRHGARLSIDIYDEEQVVVTYVDEKEWQNVEEGQRVKIQSNAIEEVIEGDVLSVSAVPAKEDEQLRVYQQLEGANIDPALAYYEVRMLPAKSLADVPYAANVKSVITTNEAFSATAIPKGWGRPGEGDHLRVIKLKENGRPTIIKATTPFTVNESVVIEGDLEEGEIVIHDPALYHYSYAPQLYFPFPSYQPTKAEWKKYGWRNYLKAMLIK